MRGRERITVVYGKIWHTLSHIIWNNSTDVLYLIILLLITTVILFLLSCTRSSIIFSYLYFNDTDFVSLSLIKTLGLFAHLLLLIFYFNFEIKYI